MRTFSFVVVLVAAGCGTRQVVGGPAPHAGTSGSTESTSAPAPEAWVRTAPPKLYGPERAELVGFALEYASIPLMHPAPRCASTSRGSCVAPTSLQLTRRPVTCEAGQQPRRSNEWVLSDDVPRGTAVHVGLVGLPISGRSAGPLQDEAGTFDALATASPTTVEWLTTELEGASSTRVRRTTGSFEVRATDPVTYVLTPDQDAQEVDALAIVPEEVYVYRTCTAGCASPLGDPARVEQLTVVAPPATWLGSSDGVPSPALADPASFARVEARVALGSSASLLVHYRGGPDAPNEAVTSIVMVDVVWPSGDAPTVTVHTGTRQWEGLTRATLATWPHRRCEPVPPPPAWIPKPTSTPAP